MKTPVCEVCMRSGVICPNCKKKLDSGKISKLDFEVALVLGKINEKTNISAASFIKALDLGKMIIILTSGECGLLIGKQGKIVSELSSALGKKVRIAQTQGDIKKTIADIIMPARLIGINNIYHEGKEVTKVRISKHGLFHLPIDVPTLQKALVCLMEREVLIVLE